MSNIVINKVYLEDDLSVFKNIAGNRVVEPSRVKKIKASIESVGMIDAPIVCNERMEVIDGQGRLQACRELEMPVPYIVVKGLTIEHCRAMNLNQTNWTLRDYIRSHADSGNANYQRLLSYMDAAHYTDSISLDVAFNGDYGNHDSEITRGSVEFSEADMTRATEIVNWMHQFDGIKTNRRRSFCRALTFCYTQDEINKGRLLRQLQSAPRAFEHLSCVYDCLGVFEDVYNKRIAKPNHVYIQHLYDVWLDSRGSLRAVKSKLEKIKE